MSVHWRPCVFIISLCVVSAASANIKLRVICPVWAVHPKENKVLLASQKSNCFLLSSHTQCQYFEHQWLGFSVPCNIQRVQLPLLINACLNRFASQVNWDNCSRTGMSVKTQRKMEVDLHKPPPLILLVAFVACLLFLRVSILGRQTNQTFILYENKKQSKLCARKKL